MQTIFRLSAATMLLAAPLAFGATGHPMDAADDKATVAAVPYESAFFGYQPRQVDELADWKAANASAGSGGGHAGHGSHMMHDMGASMPEPPAENNNPHAGHQH